MGFLSLVANGFAPFELNDPGSIIGAVAPSVIGGIMGGASGGGGGQTTQTHVNPTIPGYILNPLQQNIQQATHNANNPLYTNPAQNQVAPLTPDQQAAQQLVEQQGGQYQPVQNQAINLTNSLIGQSMAGPSSEQISSLMNPGLQNVLQQQREQSKISEQQNLALAGDQAQAQGAYGGARHGVVESQVMNNADVNLANQQAQTLYNTFNSALGQYNTGMGQAFQGSAQLGNQGVQAQNALGTYASQLSTTGGTQQANLQALMNADQQNYLQAQQYPYQQTNYLSNTLIPAGNLATGNTTNSTINQPNSTLGNVVGGAMAGNSLFGSGTSGGNFISNLFNGGGGGFNASTLGSTNTAISNSIASNPSFFAIGGPVQNYKKGGLVNHLTKHVMNSLKGYASGGNVTDTGFGGDFSGRGTDTTINIAGSQVPWAPLVGPGAAGPPGQGTTNPFSFASLSNGHPSSSYGSGFTPGAWQAGLTAAQHNGSGNTPTPTAHTTTDTIDSYRDFLSALKADPSLVNNFSNLNGAGRVNPMLTNPDTVAAMIDRQMRVNAQNPNVSPLTPYGRERNFNYGSPIASDFITYMHAAPGTYNFAKGGAIKSNAMPGEVPHSNSMPKAAAPSTNLFGNLAKGGGNTNNYLHSHRLPKYTPAKPAGMSTSLIAHPALGLGTGLATGGPVVLTTDQNRLNHFSNLSLDSRAKATGKKASFAKGGVIGFASGGDIPKFASAYDMNDATDVQDLMAGYPPMPHRISNPDDEANQNLLTHMVVNSPAAKEAASPAATSSPAVSDTSERKSFLDGVDMPELEMGLAMMGTRGTLGDKLGAAGKVLESQGKKGDKYTPVMGTDGKWYNYDKNTGTMTPMQIGLDPNKGKVSGLDDKKAMLHAQGYSDDDIALILTGQVPKGYVYKNGVATNPNGAVDAAGEMAYNKSNQSEKGKLAGNPGANVELKEGDDGTINAVNKGTLSSAPVTNSTTGNPLKGPLPSTATVADNSAYLADLPAEVKGDDVGPLLLKLHPELAPKVAMAQQLVDGDHKIPTTNRDPYNSVLDLANRMSPKGQVTGTAYTMSQDLAKSTPGSMGGQLTSLNKLGNHALAYSKLIPALAHGNTVAINQARDFFKRQTGQEAPTDIAVANKLFTSEAAKFMAGATGGSDNDRQDYQKALSVYGSPEQMNGGIKVMQDFIAAQGDALHTKVTGAGISEKKWESMLNDNAKTMLSDYKNGAASQSIPKAHALYLKAHPEAAADFDKKYGPGASAFILQQWKQ